MRGEQNSKYSWGDTRWPQRYGALISVFSGVCVAAVTVVVVVLRSRIEPVVQ